MDNCWFGSRWFGFLESPNMKRIVTLGVPLESQTTKPNQQLTITVVDMVGIILDGRDPMIAMFRNHFGKSS